MLQPLFDASDLQAALQICLMKKKNLMRPTPVPADVFIPNWRAPHHG